MCVGCSVVYVQCAPGWWLVSCWVTVSCVWEQHRESPGETLQNNVEEWRKECSEKWKLCLDFLSL